MAADKKKPEPAPDATPTLVPATVPPKLTRAQQLDSWFIYHPPTSETTPKFEAIDEQYRLAVEVFVFALERRSTGTLDPGVFEAVSRQLRAFVETIDEVCPSSADASAAVRCVRLARNGMNDILMNKQASLSFVYDQLIAAKFQANSAIATGGV